MIPKIIHYCWFGNSSLPDYAIRYIASWKKMCPDYEIKRWDESNYDYQKSIYAKEAFNKGKYAFVTDFARLDILYQYGGIILDVDVEVIKSLDKLLDNEGFIGYETASAMVNAGSGIGAVPQNNIIKLLLDEYENERFVKPDGGLDTTTCVYRQTEVLKRIGLQCNNELQVIEGFAIYPKEYLCPKDFYTGKVLITSNTYCIHHYAASWNSRIKRLWIKLRWKSSLLRYLNDFRRRNKTIKKK